MSKILCDICGTVYPDTEERCPICGYSKDLNGDNILEDPERIEETVDVEEAPVVVPPVPAPKGGSFGKSRKHVIEEEDDDDDDYDEDEDDEDDDEPRSNTFLVVILVILIVALLALSGFIIVKYFMPNMDFGATEAPTTAATETVAELPTASTAATIPCTGLVMTSNGSVVLDEEGANWLINVAAYPEDTTDTIVYTSSDESVVTVNEAGKLTAVGEGEATITITCGSESLVCKVTCFFMEETTAPAESSDPTEVTELEETTEPTEAEPDPSVSFTLKKTDVSFWVIGDTWTVQINEKDIDHKDVKWSSDNEKVCTVSEDGVVKITGKGTTTIRGEYKGHKVECIVRSV